MKVKKLIFLSILTSCLNNEIKAQATSTSHFGTLPTDWCGWNALSTVPFNLEHRGTFDINFLTGGVQRMKINGTTIPATAGFVSIGPGTANNRLDVFQGDIDVNAPRRSYMIGDTSVMWTKGKSSNIILGARAGNNHGFNQNSENTYVGYMSGFSGNGCAGIPCSPLINTQNTLIGAYSGYNNAATGAVSVGYGAGFTHNGTSTGNTFVGWKAGFLTQGSSNDNAFFGNKAGTNNTTGDNNSFFGLSAGANNTIGNFNCFFGNLAGGNNGVHNNNHCIGVGAGSLGSGDDNIFIGRSTGNQGVGNKNVVIGNNAMTTPTVSNENVTIGYNAALAGDNNDFNVFMGSQSVPAITTSSLNTMIGYKTAFTQSAGISNAYLGEATGNNVLAGNNNTFIGAKADVTTANSTTVINSAAIGADAKVTNANHMILGNNRVNVGIGLSGDATGPQNKLEIKSALANPTSNNPAVPGSWPGSTGASGLRFRTLTSASSPVPVGTGGVTNTLVLTVDQNGDAVLVTPAGGGGTGFGNLCGATANPITGHFEMPLGNVPNAFNYYFTGQNLLNNKVSVGFPCNTILRGRVRLQTNLNFHS